MSNFPRIFFFPFIKIMCLYDNVLFHRRYIYKYCVTNFPQCVLPFIGTWCLFLVHIIFLFFFFLENNAIPLISFILNFSLYYQKKKYIASFKRGVWWAYIYKRGGGCIFYEFSLFIRLQTSLQENL